ncbi:MAG: glycosyltransferase family 2 protein [Bacteroidales bacterium]|nr:glycosyltransferase family 2 protein [Bacteroidales bacterium]
MTPLQKIKQIFKGIIYKTQCDILSIKSLPFIKTKKEHPQLIVSLTSYGRRVHKTVYYTLISLFEQSRLPDRIILWLDEDNFSFDNIPENLRKLQNHGLEIKFCKDIKSYKKLIPSLEAFPNDIIVTIDDDVVYPKYFINLLYDAYTSHPECIQACVAREVEIQNGELVPYNQWRMATKESKSISPIGFGGILYPPYSLSQEVFNEDKFMSICPSADDIWFFVMAKIKGTKYNYLNIDRSDYFGIDNVYQYFHKDGALSNINVKGSNNIDQLENCIRNYNLLPTDLL